MLKTTDLTVSISQNFEFNQVIHLQSDTEQQKMHELGTVAHENDSLTDCEKQWFRDYVEIVRDIN